jgi:hypothetical protein
MPCDDFNPPRQFMKAAAPSMQAYMAKLEGRKAALAWKLPGLMTVMRRKNMPTRPFIVELVAWNMRV